MTIKSLPEAMDFVLEVTSSEGTGDLLLQGSPSVKYRPWREAFADGTAVFYAVAQEGAGFEVGEGELIYGSPDTLRRVEVLASSNGGAPVNFPQGQKVVYSTIPAAQVLQVPRDVLVVDATPAAPGSPSVGDVYLVLGLGVGDFLDLDDLFAKWSGIEWIGSPPRVGDRALVVGSGGATALGTQFVWDGSEWRLLGAAANTRTWKTLTALPITVTEEDWGDSPVLHILCTGTGTLTVPKGSDLAGPGIDDGAHRSLIVSNRSGGSVTVDPVDSGQIDGAGDLTLLNGADAELLYYKSGLSSLITRVGR